MEHFVRLDRLPEGFSVPGDLSGRFRYDADAHRLIHRGFMSKGDFDRLYLLSQDWTYRRALEELFRGCTDADDAPPRGLKGRFRALLGGFGLL